MSDLLSAGRLEDHPFAELAGLIFQGSRTGELILESGHHRRTVWFLGGNPVAVVSDDPQDHLAQFLLEHGKIGDDDARRLADLPETREALGNADFLPRETLNWGVKSRFVNLCYDLFRWVEGDYGFHDGEPPRELFLLKVPAHSLIIKGVGLLGQAAAIDALPDDDVCGPGPVSPTDARYLSPDALRLLEQCRPGRTVAEALGGRPDDREPARRLLYALSCLGLIALARGPAAARIAAPVAAEDPGFVLAADAADTVVPVPDPAATLVLHKPAEFSLEEEHSSGDFALNLPPLDAEYDSPTVQLPGRYPFAAEFGPGSFGFVSPDTPLDHREESPAPPDKGQRVPDAEPSHSSRRLHLPRIVGIAIGALAAAGIIIFAGWWWISGSEPPTPPVKPPVRRPAPLAGTPVAATPAPEPGPISQAIVPAPSAVPAAAPAPVPAAPRPTAASSGASGTDRYRNGLEIFRAGDLDGAAAIWETLLAEEHRGAFTVQVLTACQHDTVRDAQRSLTAHELYLVTRKVGGRVCYRICLGTFDSRETAVRVLSELPGEYRSGGAAVRPVADVLNRDR